MGVRSADEGVLDAGLVADAGANALEGRLAGRASEVESDDGDLRARSVEHQGIGEEGVQHAFREFVMAVGVSPHGHGLLGRNVAAGSAGLETLRAGAGRGQQVRAQPPGEEETPGLRHRKSPMIACGP